MELEVAATGAFPMRPWGRFLTAILEGALALLDALGARGTRWEWKKRTWRQALQERLAAWENLERGVRVRMRMCRACRTLVEGAPASCPACGASLRGVPGGGIGRLVRLAIPASGTLSMILLSVNVAMSFVAIAVPGAEDTGGVGRLLSPPGSVLYVLGAKWTPSILGGQVWRLVTASYLHGGLLHLLFNSYALMNLAPLIEEAFGARKLFVIYTATGVLAFATSTVLRPGALSVGASGALFGLIGFAVVFGRYRGGAAGRALSDHLMRWLVLGAVMFLIPGIDSAAHLGGAASGAILGLVVPPGQPRSPAANAGLWLLFGLALALTLGSFGAMALAYRESVAAMASGA